MKKMAYMGLINILSVNLAHAGDVENSCANFQIRITNVTHSVCTLTDQRVIHGDLISSPPSTLSPNTSARFDMKQSMRGAGVRLSYQCGNENITFGSKQNFCLLEAGNISGRILHPMPVNITAGYMAQPGSHYWEKAGNISWSIRETSSTG